MKEDPPAPAMFGHGRAEQRLHTELTPEMRRPGFAKDAAKQLPVSIVYNKASIGHLEKAKHRPKGRRVSRYPRH